jgi:hypothetical protein
MTAAQSKAARQKTKPKDSSVPQEATRKKQSINPA